MYQVLRHWKIIISNINARENHYLNIAHDEYENDNQK